MTSEEIALVMDVDRALGARFYDGFHVDADGGPETITITVCLSVARELAKILLATEDTEQ